MSNGAFVIRSANHWRLNDITGRRGLRTAMVECVRERMRYYGLGRGYASRWPDGSIALYHSLAELRRDQTGEHAAALVTRWSPEEGDQ